MIGGCLDERRHRICFPGGHPQAVEGRPGRHRAGLAEQGGEREPGPPGCLSRHRIERPQRSIETVLSFGGMNVVAASESIELGQDERQHARLPQQAEGLRRSIRLQHAQHLAGDAFL